MGKRSKRFREIDQKIEPLKLYTLEEAIALQKSFPSVKFDQSVDIACKLGVNPRKSDQQVRGTVPLPSGTGKTLRILVFAQGDKVQEALDTGADYAGSTELFEKVSKGWTDFDAVIATPDLMREVGRLGKVLGPRNLMPTPKAGTVTPNVAGAIQELKAGKIEFKVDKHGVINVMVGKLSFDPNAIEANVRAVIAAILRARPATAKGVYMPTLALSTTMGPGLKLDVKQFEQGGF